MGWLSPALLILQSDDSPLTSGPVTVEESSWLGSLIFLGSISGYIFNSGLAKAYGRKLILALQVFPNVVRNSQKYEIQSNFFILTLKTVRPLYNIVILVIGYVW